MRCSITTLIASLIVAATAYADPSPTSPPGPGAPAADVTQPAERPEPATSEVPPAPSEAASPAQTAPAEDHQEDQGDLPPQTDLPSLDSPIVGKIVHTTEPQTRRPISFYVPTTHKAGQPMPLLVDFTASGVSRDNIMKLWRLGEARGAIVLTPETWSVRGPPEDRVEAQRQIEGWSRDAGDTKVPHYVRDAAKILTDLRADAEAVRQAVALLSSRYTVDPKVVVLTGSSGGSWIAYYTGLADPERYAGICVRSGNFDRRLLPPNPGRARDIPISIVIGDRDLDVVLAETDAAEKYFKSLKFTNLNIERLPHSGHDSRPEVAFNFLAMLRAERMAERKEAWQRALKAGLKAAQEKKVKTARYELGRAAELERQFGFPDEATRALDALDGGNAASGPAAGAGDAPKPEKPATN
jgi:predicted esterase